MELNGHCQHHHVLGCHKLLPELLLHWLQVESVLVSEEILLGHHKLLHKLLLHWPLVEDLLVLVEGKHLAMDPVAVVTTLLV